MVTEFKATLMEKIIVAVVMVFSYIYFTAFCVTDFVARILLGIFVIGFIGIGEVMFWNIKRSVESYIFLVLTLMISISYCFDVGAVWESGAKIFFIHLFAVYWLICRADRLVEGRTSHLFAVDGVVGFVLIPFSNYILGIETIGTVFSGIKKNDRKRLFIIFGSILLGIILFVCAMSFLKDSDANFEAMMSIFDIEFEWKYIFRIGVSVIIGLYLYGLFGGYYRTDRRVITEYGNIVNRTIAKLNKVPEFIWVIFIALFSIFYIVFFLLQGSYLFDSLSMILPANYTFSQNAHKGFENMCAVMLINFLLTWLTLRTSEKKNMAIKISTTVLMVESLIFALIAFLKLYMYIDVYGFTPLRLQSVWLVCVLIYACICIIIRLYTGKKTAGVWFIGSAASLAVLTLF